MRAGPGVTLLFLPEFAPHEIRGSGRGNGTIRMKVGLRLLLLTAALALGLSACGVKGPLEPPPGATPPPAPGPDGKVPHQPFPLDRILQ